MKVGGIGKDAMSTLQLYHQGAVQLSPPGLFTAELDQETGELPVDPTQGWDWSKSRRRKLSV